MARKSTADNNSLNLTDMAKKVIYASLGSASIAKNIFTNSSIQRELLGSLLSRAERTKDDLMEVLASEVSKFLGKVNIAEEVTRSLKGLIINLNASIDFDAKNGRPSVKVKSARAKRKSKK